MNRALIIQAILHLYDQFGLKDQKYLLRNALLYISDLNLLALATDMGIDIQGVLPTTEVKS